MTQKNEKNNLDVSTESIEMLIEDEPEEKKIVSRKVVARKPVKMRDFTNEEKGEEVDEIEVLSHIMILSSYYLTHTK